MSDKNNKLTNGIQKLDENDLEKVSGGYKDVKDISRYLFYKNIVLAYCDSCGA